MPKLFGFLVLLIEEILFVLPRFFLRTVLLLFIMAVSLISSDFGKHSFTEGIGFAVIIAFFAASLIYIEYVYIKIKTKLYIGFYYIYNTQNRYNFISSILFTLASFVASTLVKNGSIFFSDTTFHATPRASAELFLTVGS